jgi:hypothetical protein
MMDATSAMWHTRCDRCRVLNSMLVRNDGYGKCDLNVWVR